MKALEVGSWTALRGLRCESGACAQARDMAADDRIAERDYVEGLCHDHERLHDLLRAAKRARADLRLIASTRPDFPHGNINELDYAIQLAERPDAEDAAG